MSDAENKRIPREAREGLMRAWKAILQERHPDVTWVMREDLRSPEDAKRRGRRVAECGMTSRRLEVLHVGKYYPPVPGGMERVLKLLCDRERHHVDTRVLVMDTGRRTIRDVVGPDIGISLDVQFDYRMGGIIKLARAMEPFNLYWLEVEDLDPGALLAAREQTTTRFCHGESLFRRDQFRPFFQSHVTDVVMLETLSNGFSETRKIAEMAELYDVMVSPHNWMSPLTTMINAQLCAALSNVEILEIDMDDVPWKWDLIDPPLRIENGELIVPSGPGLGAEVVEEVARAHPIRGHERAEFLPIDA